ncbi:MAG: hypothetical protein M1816_008176 [Peltula sp. TS41687]|nr:MAG: hypothetical protein M1816_008176 [Peltula sp. TS41687]
MRSIAVTLLSVSLATLTSAFTKPVGDTPSGNPIYKPNLGDIVPKGQPYTITWGPTSTGTITLLLLRGPSENVVPLKPIAEGIPNTGSYIWTPDSSLEPDTTHYGIQLIQDSNGAYQYSTQFGIGGDAAVTTSTSSVTSTSSAYSTSSVYSTSSDVTIANVTTSATLISATTSELPLPTTTFFKYYNGSCHACPPHNQTTTYLNTETLVDVQPTASANATAPSSYPTQTQTQTTAPSTPIPATNAAGQTTIQFGSTAVVVAGLFVALMI